MAIRTRIGATGQLVTYSDGYGSGKIRILAVKQIKPASFKGIHNRTRAVCLLLLADSQLMHSQGGVLSAKQLSELSGLSYGSIMASVGKWCRWHYIKRIPIERYKVRSGWLYELSPRGRTWVKRHWHHFSMQLALYDTELQQTRGYGFAQYLAGKLLAPTEELPTACADHMSASDYFEDEEEDY